MVTPQDLLQFQTRFNRHFKRNGGPSIIFKFSENQIKVVGGEKFYLYRLIVSPLPPFRFNVPSPSYISGKTIRKFLKDGFGQLGFEITSDRKSGLIWKSLDNQIFRRLYIASLFDWSSGKRWIKLGSTSHRDAKCRFNQETGVEVGIESIRTLDFWDAPTKGCLCVVENLIRSLSLEKLTSAYPSIDFVFASAFNEYPLRFGGNSECMEIPDSLDFQTIRDIIWGVYDELYVVPSSPPPRKKPELVRHVSFEEVECNDFTTLSTYLGSFVNNTHSPGYDLTPWQFLRRFPPLRCKKLADARPTQINTPGVFKTLLLQSRSVSFKVATPSPGEVNCYVDGSRLILNFSPLESSSGRELSPTPNTFEINIY